MKNGVKRCVMERPLHSRLRLAKGQVRASQQPETGGSYSIQLTMTRRRVYRPVADMTALKGVYDIDLEWAADDAAADSTPSLSTVLREKLGLHIDSRKAPVDLYVTDRVDHAPTEN